MGIQIAYEKLKKVDVSAVYIWKKYIPYKKNLYKKNEQTHKKDRYKDLQWMPPITMSSTHQNIKKYTIRLVVWIQLVKHAKLHFTALHSNILHTNHDKLHVAEHIISEICSTINTKMCTLLKFMFE